MCSLSDAAIVMAIGASVLACGRVGLDDPARPRGLADAPTVSYASAVLASGPLAYYRLDEASGPTARDASGNGNDASYMNGGGTIVYQRGGALVGDPDRAVELSSSSGVNVAAVTFAQVSPIWSGDFSIEAFIRPTAPPQMNYADALVLCESYLTDGFRTGWTPSYQLQFWTSESGGTATVDTPGGFDPNAWNHVVFVRIGSALTLYLDGVDVASGTIDYIAPSAGAQCGFGAFDGMQSHADFDEVAIYSRGLMASEIAAHVAAAR